MKCGSIMLGVMSIDSRNYESALQRVVKAWIVTGLAFLLAPGTFLGVWNLLEISGQRSAAQISPAWIQAHGHAQIFGWIGTFILGIGFYSLSKMADVARFPVRRAWIAWALWTAGVLLRWIANIYELAWRVFLPTSAVLELTAFLIFFATVSKHKPQQQRPVGENRPTWILVVAASTQMFMIALGVNVAGAIWAAVNGTGPALPHGLNQRFLALYAWGFPVLAIWGFNARWLPVFLGLRAPRESWLKAAVAAALIAVASALLGLWLVFAIFALVASAMAAAALHVFTRAVNPPKTLGVHPTFPAFVRLAYVWLLISAGIGLLAARFDTAGGLWGASRHALTVGFFSTMVFAIGQRVLPAFCGMHVLYSPRLMFIALASLNAGCLLRVAAETGAYEGYAPALWPVLPVSAILEMAAVAVFAANLLITFTRPATGRITSAMPAPLRAPADQ
jgi:hypothetical protein